MALTLHSIVEHAKALAAYLPNGKTFVAKHIRDSNLWRLLQGLAGEMRNVESSILTLEDEFIPDATVLLLDEWEQAVGIPDGCFTGAGTAAKRRQDVLTKLSSLGVQTDQDFKGLALLYGVNLVISAGIPYRPVFSAEGLIGSVPPYDVPFTPTSDSIELVCWLRKLVDVLSVPQFRNLDLDTWTLRTTAARALQSIAWSPKLGIFCAVGDAGFSEGAMTSPDGEVWTLRVVLGSGVDLREIVWSAEKEIFVAVSANNALSYVSSDGIAWAAGQATVEQWRAVTWAASMGKFVALSALGGISSAATSVDGLVWSATPIDVASWRSIAWSPELGRLVAVANGGAGTVVMTSDDGVTWVPQSAPVRAWEGVVWSPKLGIFCAVASSNSTTNVMTSVDGFTWVSRTAPALLWSAVIWAEELAIFIATSWFGAAGDVMTSGDGITWVLRDGQAGYNWRALAWSPELSRVAAVSIDGADSRRVMTLL